MGETAFLLSKGSVVDQIAAGATEILAALSGGILDGTSAPEGQNSAQGGAILVGDGSATITANDANNLIIGGSTVTVGNGDNLIVGTTGDQTVKLGLGNNIVDGESGHSTVDYTNLDKPGSTTTFTLTAGQLGPQEILVSKTANGASSSGATPHDDLYGIGTIKVGSGDTVKVDTTAVQLDLQAQQDGILDFLNDSKPLTYTDGTITNSKITYSGFDALVSTHGADTFNITVPASPNPSSFYRIDGGGGGDTFNVNYSAGNNTPLLLESGGSGDFELKNTDQASFTVLWGGGGKNVYDLTSPADSDTVVMCVHINGLTEQNFLQLDISKLESYLNTAYPRFSDPQHNS